ncbi:MAG: hypothetical protein ACTSV6_01215 [Candidatus Heimdallarchaeota archaeon]
MEREIVKGYELLYQQVKKNFVLSIIGLLLCTVNFVLGFWVWGYVSLLVGFFALPWLLVALWLSVRELKWLKKKLEKIER